MMLIRAALLAAAILMTGCGPQQNGPAAPSQESKSQENKTSGKEPYAVKTTLKEYFSVDPEKRIGVYGRYTELSAGDDVPEVLSRIIAEVNARAKESVEKKAARFLAENQYPSAEAEPGGMDHFRYRSISCIMNVTRADHVLFSILETEMESGIGDKEGEHLNAARNCSFRAAVYETQSGRLLTPADFLKDPGSFPELLEKALENKYALDAGAGEGLFPEEAAADGASAGDSSSHGSSAAGSAELPAWTADYLGLHFYFDGNMLPEDKMQELDMNARKAVHVSIPYTALDGAMSAAASETPKSFIARLEKNTEYALPHDKRVIRVEKGMNSGYEQYRIVIRDRKDEKAWWLEYADDDSDYYVFRAQDGYYFYRLDDWQDRAYVYNFASPDGGFDRFENQNAQCFDSFLHELGLAVPYDPECVHMRERSRRFMDASSGLNTSFVPNGHYTFLPEQGRGRTWLHFALTDDALALDSRNVGCRLLHEISGKTLDEKGNEDGETVVKEGEVLRFLRAEGESELYYYMSRQYNSYRSGARDYCYDCELADGRQVRLVTKYENSFFVDGMYMDRIGEPVTIGAAQYEAGMDAIPEHYAVIGGKEYKLIRDLSLKTEDGEEIDFAGDVWWIVENYTGTYTAAEEAAVSGKSGSPTPEDTRLVISENGDVSFEYDGRVFTGKLPEKRYYGRDAEVFMEAGYEQRTFRIIVMDNLPPHDPSFQRICFYSEGLPATNEPSRVPPIEVELVRDGKQ